MSRFIIPVKDAQGNKVYFQTSGHKGQITVDGYTSVVLWLEKNGFTLAKDVQETPQKPLESTTQSHDPSFCSIHNAKMEEREGKFGKFYSHSKKVGENVIFCNGKGWKE